MVNILANNADTKVDDQAIVLPDHGQEIREHTPRPQPLAPAPWTKSPDTPTRPRTLEIHRFCGLENIELGIPQKTRPAVPTVQEAETAGTTSNVDMDHQLLIESACGDNRSNLPLPNVHLPRTLSPMSLSQRHVRMAR